MDEDVVGDDKPAGRGRVVSDHQPAVAVVEHSVAGDGHALGRTPALNAEAPVVIDEVVPDVPSRAIVVDPVHVGASPEGEVSDVANHVADDVDVLGVGVDAGPAVAVAGLRDDIVDVVPFDHNVGTPVADALVGVAGDVEPLNGDVIAFIVPDVLVEVAVPR